MGTSIESLMTTDPGVYRATASVKDNGLDASSTVVTGDRTGDLWTTSDTGGMQKDDFLLLLVTQLKFQDPLSPMENTELVTQMAQLRSIEGTNNIQKAVEGLKDSFKGTVDAQTYSAQSVSNAAAVSLIGKEVRLRQTTLDFGARVGETEQFRVHLGNAATAEVQLVDDDGNVVKSFTAADKDSENSVLLSWDGVKDDGTRATAGTYHINITGADTNSALYAFVEDVVYGVRFSSEGALIKVGGQELSIGSVLDVSAGEGGSGFAALSPSSAVALLGKQIRIRQDSVYFGARTGENVTLQVNGGSHDSVTVRICDRLGNTVRVLPAQVENGVATVTWDGRLMDEATKAAAGLYSVEIDESEIDPSVYPYAEGVVEGISTANGGTFLRLNGRLVSLGDIVDIAPVEESGQEDTV